MLSTPIKNLKIPKQETLPFGAGFSNSDIKKFLELIFTNSCQENKQHHQALLLCAEVGCILPSDRNVKQNRF